MPTAVIEPEMHLIGHGGTDALKNNLEKNIFSCHKGFLSLNYPLRHCKLRNNLVLLFLSYFTQKCKSLEDKKTKKRKN